MQLHWGWRSTCWVWAGVHLVLCLPLYLSLPSDRRAPTPAPAAMAEPDGARAGLICAPACWLWCLRPRLASSAAPWPHACQALLQACGIAAGLALTVGMLMGPAQVAARLLEFDLLRHLPPLVNARLAARAAPRGAALLSAGPPGRCCFGVLHGAGNGVLTIPEARCRCNCLGPGLRPPPGPAARPGARGPGTGPVAVWRGAGAVAGPGPVVVAALGLLSVWPPCWCCRATWRRTEGPAPRCAPPAPPGLSNP